MVRPGVPVIELAQGVREAQEPLRIVGLDSYSGFRAGGSGRRFCLRPFAGIVEYQPADMVVTVRAGTSLTELNEELAVQEQCLPIFLPEGFPKGTVGGGISMAMPHPLESKWGSWRDWVLGLNLLLADGTVVKCGSRAVKNVAGYDAQKLIVGSRGSIAIVLEATLRTAPKTASDTLPKTVRRGVTGALKCVHRVLRRDFEEAFQSARETVLFACPETATFWLAGEPSRRFEGDWLLNSGHGEANFELRNKDQVRFMLRAKDIFDPSHKLNPKEWEFL